MNLYELYDYAVDQGIDVDWYTMPFAKSFSIFIPSLDRRAIALDPWKFETVADEFTTLGHEVGHCMTYSFYNRWTACDCLLYTSQLRYLSNLVISVWVVGMRKPA